MHSWAWPQPIRKQGRREETLALASLSPRTGGHRPLNPAWPMQPVIRLSADSARKELFLKSSSCLAPNFHVKTSARYYPDLANYSSQPLIIKQCLPANSAPSPDSGAASPVLLGGLQFHSWEDPESELGTGRFGPAALQKQGRGRTGVQVVHQRSARN